MKQEKTPLPAAKKGSGPRSPVSDPWRPTWKWHLKVLGGIYLALIIVYVGVTALLSRLPPPYGLRNVPREITPWLKK